MRSCLSMCFMKLTMTVAMYCINVDTSETIPRGRKDDYSKVYHCVSFKFSRELGQ